ncbi:MAG TPA: energy transducer TonB [Candidatus Polarisedimenticolaceae bacterium]
MRGTTWIVGLLVTTCAAACEPCDRARALIAAGQPAQADDLLREAIREDKKNPALHGWRIVALASQDRGRDAVGAFKSFLKLGPSPELWSTVRAALPVPRPMPGVDVLARCEEDVTPPVLLESAAPAYPEAGRLAGLEKDILVLATVGPKGTVIYWDWDRVGDWGQAHYAGFGSAAMEAVIKWRFFPALRDGVPVPCDFQADMTFRLIKGL